MKNLTLFLSIFLLISCGSDNTYYENDKTGKIISQTELDDMKDDLERRFKEKFDQVSVTTEIKNTRQSGDSIIYTYALDIVANDGQNRKDNLEVTLPDGSVGMIFPTIETTQLSGENIKLPMQGKPTLINFWFTTCPPCIDEMPVLNAIKKEYEDRVNFIAMTFEKEDKVKQFLKDMDFNFDHIVDQQETSTRLGIQTYPKTYILDATGKVLSIADGLPYIQDTDGNLVMSDGAELRKQLDELLK